MTGYSLGTDSVDADDRKANQLKAERFAPALCAGSMSIGTAALFFPSSGAMRPGDGEKTMKTSRQAVVLSIFLACAFAQQSFGEERSKIIGTWQLVSYVVEVQATGQKIPAMGDKPTGYASFLPEGRVFFVLTGEGRKPAKTDQERAGLLNTLVAYTGTYSIEGDKWTTSVDVAWNPEWVGTHQVRSFKLEGDRLYVMTPWRVMPNWAAKGMTRSIITFERAE